MDDKLIDYSANPRVTCLHVFWASCPKILFMTFRLYCKFFTGLETQFAAFFNAYISWCWNESWYLPVSEIAFLKKCVYLNGKKKPKPTNQTKWTTTNWPITNHSVILDVAQVQDFALGFVVGFVEVLLHPLLKPVSVSLNGIWFLELVDNWSLPSTSFHYLYCNKIFWQYKALTFSINPVGDSWH